MRPATPSLLLLCVLALALAPPAVAKGPHASVDTGPAGIEPGKPWVTTLTLVEYSGRQVTRARPVVILRSGSARFAVTPKLVEFYVPRYSDVLGEARYRLRVVFPRAGRWSYTVVDGTAARRRFRFPAATIGGAAERVTTGHAVFPLGSRAHADGGGGPIVGEAEPPAVVVEPPGDREDGGGLALWIPAAGLTLAGVGALTMMRRRRG
jgi:hypothetical protein